MADEIDALVAKLRRFDMETDTDYSTGGTFAYMEQCDSGDYCYADEAIAAIRALQQRVEGAERQRDALISACNALLNIPSMTDAQLAELKARCQSAIAARAVKGARK